MCVHADITSSCFWVICIHICGKCLDIGLVVRVFADGLGDLGSIPGRVISKTQKKKKKMVLMPPCLTL